MNNQGAGLPGGLPAGQQTGQNVSAIQPLAGAAQAVPGAVQGMAMPGLQPFASQQQALFLHQMHQLQYQQLMQTGKLTQEILNQNPHLNMIHRMQQQFLSAQIAGARPAAAAAAAGMAGSKGATGAKNSSGIPTLATAPGSVNAFLHQKGPPQAAVPAPAAATAAPSRKRKAEHYRLPDKRYDIMPDSPLFVSLQDAERRIDAAIERKMAALYEIEASAKRVVEGRAVGDTPGSARKRLRIYIFSRHHNQPSENLPPQDPSVPADPPSWSLHINGRILDPDACHPGGGGDPEPPEAAHVARHRFTYYLKRLEVRLDGRDGPLRGSPIVWQKASMDHEWRNSFEILRMGDEPVEATIILEMDYQPELCAVPATLESLVGLQAGEDGAPGVYSRTYIASKILAYARTQGLVLNTIDGPVVKPTEVLLSAFNVPKDEISATIAARMPLTAQKIQDMVNGIVSPPQPLVLRHTIAVDGPITSPISCLDIHLEIPFVFEDSKGFASVVADADAMEKELEQLDHALATCYHWFKEHKRRHIMFSAFSDDPVGCIREIVAAQGRELRVAAGKESEAAEVMKAVDMYGDRWTQDAILKYLAKKAAGPAPVPQLLMQPAAGMFQQQQRLMATMIVAQQQQLAQQVAAAQQMQQAQAQQQQQAAAAAAAPAVAPAPGPAPASGGAVPQQ